MKSLQNHAPSRATIFVAGAFVLGLPLWSGSSHADDPPPPELRHARQALHHYDTGGGTLHVIGQLHRMVPRSVGANQREARFLRAVASTDLLMLSYGSGGAAAQRGRLAETLGVDVAHLTEFLDTELASLEMGAYEEAARDSRWALRALNGGNHDPELLLSGHGIRRDIMFSHAVVDAMDAPDAASRLAALGRAIDATSEVAMFSRDGRRMVDALREAERAIERLERAASADEPLTASLAGTVAIDATMLRSTEVRPAMRFPESADVHMVGDRGRPSSPDFVVWVDGLTVRYAFTRTVQISAHGVAYGQNAQPALPHHDEIVLHDESPMSVAPYDALVERFEAIVRAHAPTSVGLAATSTVESHTMSRVLISLQRAGLPTPQLLGRDEDGGARSLRIDLVTPSAVLANGRRNHAATRSPFAVYIRLGGFTVHRRSQTVSMARMRDASGLHFDFAGLERIAAAAGLISRSIRYMGIVPWGVVLDAAFRMEGPAAIPLHWVLY